eukprot:UN29093
MIKNLFIGKVKYIQQKKIDVTKEDGKPHTILVNETLEHVLDHPSKINSEPNESFLWYRIPKKRKPFTHGHILGCCVDCEKRTIEYWIDDEKIPEATFTNVKIGKGVYPALSFTGMLPTKITVKKENMKYLNKDKNARSVGEHWERNDHVNKKS